MTITTELLNQIEAENTKMREVMNEVKSLIEAAPPKGADCGDPFIEGFATGYAEAMEKVAIAVRNLKETTK
jgi:hypothetical protein